MCFLICAYWRILIQGQDWKFKAVGAGSNATTVSALAYECFTKFK